MHLIFDDYDAWVLRSVHDERVPAVQDGAVAVSGIERHQRITPLNLRRKAREDISIFEHRVVGDRFEVVVAIDRTGQPLHDDVEEWVERHERGVFGIGHELAPSCRLRVQYWAASPGDIATDPVISCQETSLLRGIQEWIVVIWPIRPRSTASAAKSIAARFARL